jgi:hypothetical protein
MNQPSAIRKCNPPRGSCRRGIFNGGLMHRPYLAMNQFQMSRPEIVTMRPMKKITNTV